MNKVEKQVAGIGGIVGGVGYLIAFVIVGSAEYTAANMADYISKDQFAHVLRALIADVNSRLHEELFSEGQPAAV